MYTKKIKITCMRVYYADGDVVEIAMPGVVTENHAMREIKRTGRVLIDCRSVDGYVGPAGYIAYCIPREGVIGVLCDAVKILKVKLDALQWIHYGQQEIVGELPYVQTTSSTGDTSTNT